MDSQRTDRLAAGTGGIAGGSLHFRFLAGLSLLAMLSLAVFASWWARGVVEKEERRRLVDLAAQMASTITPERIERLSFTEADKDNPAYQRLCSQMRSYGEAIGFASIYSVALRDGELKFGPESIAPGTPLSSAPGSVYRQPPPGLKELFKRESVASSLGPYKDEYGSFVSAFSPVVDRQSGETLMLVGVDLPESEFRSRLSAVCFAPFVYVFLLTALLALACWGFERRRGLPVERQGLLRHVELVLSISIGLLLTLGFAQLFGFRESISREDAFSRFAYENASALEDSLRTIRERGEDLARLLEIGGPLDFSAFSKFAGPFVGGPSAVAYGWCREMDASETGSLLASARAGLDPGYAIWGGPAKSGGQLCPVIVIEPLEPNRPALGYDLASDPQTRKALAVAKEAALPASSGVVSLAEGKAFKGIFACFPAFERHDEMPDRLLGFSFAVLNPEMTLEDAMSKVKRLGALVDIDVYECSQASLPSLLCSWPASAAERKPDIKPSLVHDPAGLRLAYPIFIFGRSYAAVVSPSHEFLALYPSRGAWLAAFFGLLLTFAIASSVFMLKRQQGSLERQVATRTEELAGQRARLLNVIEGMDAGTWEWDLRTGRISCNERWAEMFGYSLQELAPLDIEVWRRLCHPEDLPLSEAKLSAHFKGLSGSYSCECRAKHKSGEWIWVHDRGKVLERGPDGTPYRMFGTHTDISARKAMDQHLKDSEALWRMLLDSISVGVIMVDPETRVIEKANIAAARLFGAEIEEIQGNRCHRFLCPAEEGKCPVLDLDQSVDDSERVMLRSDGTRIPILKSVKKVQVNGKDMLLESFVDISKRKQAEAALIASERLYRSLFREMLNGYALHEIICDAAGKPCDYRFLEVNPAFERMTGLRNADISGRTVLEAIPGTEPYWIDIYGSVALGGQPLRFENYAKAFDKHFEVVAFCPERGRFATVFTDVTERKKEEAELLRLSRTVKALGESRLALIRASDELAYLNDVCKIVVDLCEHALVWVGYAEDDEAKSIRPVAYAGISDGYLETLHVTWANVDNGRGPVGTAVRTGKPCVFQSLRDNPRFKPWREEALKRGYTALAALPLLDEGRSFGVIAIYAGGCQTFSDDELDLLRKLADDLTYGVVSLRLREAHAKAMEAVAGRERELKAIAETSPVPLIIARESDWALLFANPLAIDTFLLSREAGSLGSLDALFPSVELFRDIEAELRGRGGLDNYEVQMKRSDSSVFFSSISMKRGRFRTENCIFIGLVDITPLKAVESDLEKTIQDFQAEALSRIAAEEKVRASEEEYRMLFDTAQVGIWKLSPEGRIISTNAKMCEMLGVGSVEELAGRSCFEFIVSGSESRAHMLESSPPGEDGRAISSYEAELLGSGKRINVIASSLSLFKRHGVVEYYVETFTDISFHKQTELEREAVLEILRLLNRSCPIRELIKSIVEFIQRLTACEAVGIRLREGDDFPYFETRGFSKEFVALENSLCERDLEGQLKRDSSGNPCLECMCGNILSGRFDPSKPFFTTNGSFWSNCTTELLKSTTEKDRQARTRNRCNGEGYESVALIPLRGAGVTFGLLQVNDRRRDRFTPSQIGLLERIASNIASSLAERKAAESLRESEAKTHSILDNIGIGVSLISSKMEILEMNRRMREWFPEVELERRPVCHRVFNKPSREAPCDYCPTVKTLKDGLVHEAITQTPRGSETRIFRLVSSPVLNAEGQIVAAIELVEDITVMKALETEAEKQRRQLIQADKMKALGILVSGVAHEINNPTNFIMLNAPILREAWTQINPMLDGYFRAHGDFSVSGLPYSEMREMVPSLCDGLEDGAKRIKSIVAGLKDFARQDVSTGHDSIDVNVVVDAALSLLSHMLNKATRKLSVKYASGLPSVRGSAQKLEQVVINLVQNAAQALPSPEKGIFISTAMEGEMVLIDVRDEGVGIEEKDFANVLDPFFTTKRDSGGTGLGLPISDGIVRDMGGQIRISSKRGEGTDVSVLLPPLRKDAASSDSKGQAPQQA